jgi:hypothetical protein
MTFNHELSIGWQVCTPPHFNFVFEHRFLSIYSFHQRNIPGRNLKHDQQCIHRVHTSALLQKGVPVSDWQQTVGL